jgi:hypothetical protein
VERWRLTVNSPTAGKSAGAGYSIGTANRPISCATSFNLRSSCSATALARRDKHSSSLTTGGGGVLLAASTWEERKKLLTPMTVTSLIEYVQTSRSHAINLVWRLEVSQQ